MIYSFFKTKYFSNFGAALKTGLATMCSKRECMAKTIFLIFEQTSELTGEKQHDDCRQHKIIEEKSNIE